MNNWENKYLKIKKNKETHKFTTNNRNEEMKK